LGDIQGKGNARSLGKPQEALVSYEHVIKLLEPVAEMTPDNPLFASSMDTLIDALTGKAGTLFLQSRKQEAMIASKQAFDAASRLATIPNANYKQYIPLINATLNHTRYRADLEQNPQISKQGTVDALALHKVAHAKSPTSGNSEERVWMLRGDARIQHALGQILLDESEPASWSSALENFLAALNASEEVLRLRPDADNTRKAIGAHHRAIAATLDKQGRLAEAIEHDKAAAGIVRTLMLRDPLNQQSKQDMVQVLSGLANSYMRAGEHQKALNHVTEARELIAKLTPELRDSERTKSTLQDLSVSEKTAYTGLQQHSGARR
jgi:tetratricopeptide (TPR) repeat protein